jgi:hypothetical protein
LHLSPVFYKGLSSKSRFSQIKESSGMGDKTIVCKDCSHEFVFNESEQAFYKEKGFENEPQRCPDCRAAKKQQMGNRGGYGGGGNRSGGNRNSGGGGNRW